MRQVILDTETTGLEPQLGHRIIEIGCIEVVNRRRTGRRLHRYLCPDREIDFGALQVHGITDEFLRGQPRFADVAAELREFISGAELIIHNAPFDVAFLEKEFGALGDDLRVRVARRLHACSIRSRSRDACTPGSATVSMHSASVTASTTRSATCTARCSMPSCCSMSTWR